MTGQEPDPDTVAALALRKAAAFDHLAGWLGAELGLEWSDATDPQWVSETLRGKAAELFLLGRNAMDLRDRYQERPWLRRRGW